MARIRNDEEYALRKAKIVNGTIGMIMSEGYESFSLNKLLKSIELSKSSFFHYFESKQELLDEVIKVSSDRLLDTINEIEERDGLTSKEKIIELFHLSSRRSYHYANRGEQLAQSIYSIANKKFIDLVTAATVPRFTRFLSKLLEEGVKDGSFTIIDFQGTLNQLICLIMNTNRMVSNYALSDKTDEMTSEIMETIAVFERIFEYLIGTNELGPLYILIDEEGGL